MNKRNPVLDEISSSVRARVARFQLHRSSLRTALDADPNAPTREVEANRAFVITEVGVLGEFLEVKLIPLIKEARRYAPDLLVRNERVACYWLIGKATNNWRGALVLAREGMFYEVMELMRSIQESNWLVCHFLLGHRSELTKWFEGEIVKPSKTRKRVHAWMNERAKKLELSLPIEQILLTLYSGLSRYSHSSYAALLDSYDVWHESFDFDRIAGFHHLRFAGLPHMREALVGTMTGLMLFFQFCGDHKSRAAVRLLSEELSPDDQGDWEERVRAIAANLSRTLT